MSSINTNNISNSQLITYRNIIIDISNIDTYYISNSQLINDSNNISDMSNIDTNIIPSSQLINDTNNISDMSNIDTNNISILNCIDNSPSNNIKDTSYVEHTLKCFRKKYYNFNESLTDQFI